MVIGEVRMRVRGSEGDSVRGRGRVRVGALKLSSTTRKYRNIGSVNMLKRI